MSYVVSLFSNNFLVGLVHDFHLRRAIPPRFNNKYEEINVSKDGFNHAVTCCRCHNTDVKQVKSVKTNVSLDHHACARRPSSLHKTQAAPPRPRPAPWRRARESTWYHITVLNRTRATVGACHPKHPGGGGRVCFGGLGVSSTLGGDDTLFTRPRFTFELQPINT